MNVRSGACHLVIAFFGLLVCESASAVSPLITDDADTVEPGKQQLNLGWLLTHSSPETLSLVPANFITGINSRSELGVTFGYQFRDTNSSAAVGDANGVTDILLANKWQLWQSRDQKVKIGFRFDLKLPVASKARGLGTGDVDAGFVMIATRSWGDTMFDWNIGYVAVDLPGRHSADDRWFLGQAIRHKLDQRWSVVGETFALLANTGAGGPSTFHAALGGQFSVNDHLVLSALAGTELGDGKPSGIGSFGMTISF
jgi:hypothetical protein